MRLAERNDLRESEGQQVARYLDGLKPQLQDKIGVQVLYNLNEAKNMAMKAELMLQENGSKWDSNRRGLANESFPRNTIDRSTTAQEVQKVANEDKAVGKRPMDKGEKQKPANPTSKSMVGKCYRCLQPGHRSGDCPNRRGINIVERETEDEIYCESDEGDEEGDFDKGEDEGEPSFVIRRLMLAPKQDDATQRHQLFRTRCTINGRVFDLIIDSGSCENIIGRDVVNSLQLAVEKHPNPYSIGWIKAAEKIKVTERCKVPFSIGKYNDEVYCDVVDMDVCHLLFGRPWQFDVNAQDAGRDNMYKLERG
ncbi:hypothetical protein LUZ63_006163 [Rhynchospora breviuscula]|uniref:CCHC-type domain-containing protein n=1 Tax=Rhynchospora breviuscula TaxID=2022672 RepID=A0A9Q0CPI7_9POAL|nr:hypothetical protein LUZ63_006163 [Rhynchospora breviuscula]